MMTFHAWRKWVQGIPWSLRWVIYLILIRPFLDTLWQFKDVSVFLAPANVVGAFSPVLALWAIATIRRPPASGVDRVWTLWSVLICISAAMLFSSVPFFEALRLSLTLILPVYIYAVLRRLLRERKDLQGLMQTFLFSLAVPAGLFLYEIFVQPIGTETARGLERIIGAYADSTSYGFYLNLGFVVVAYFFLRVHRPGRSVATLRREHILMLAVVIIAAVLLVRLNHAASFATFGALFVLFLFFNVRKGRTAQLAFVVILAGLVLIWKQDVFVERITQITETDLEVMQGERDEGQAFHGRMARWQRHMDIFLSSPIYARAFGLPLADTDDVVSLVSRGAHNDYLRIMYTTGVVGLAAYLLILVLLLVRSFRTDPNERFLFLGMLGVIMLYSVSTTPTLYFNVAPIALAAFAYVAEKRRASTTPDDWIPLAAYSS